MSETAQQAYVRGVEAGRIAIRLDHHDDQIAATNLVLARTVEISQTLSSTVQTLTEARVTDAATRVTTAEAVEAAKVATETQDTKRWSPLSKFLVAALGLVAILSFVGDFLPSLTGG